MLLDTGADASLVPREAIATIVDADDDLPQYELEAFDGTKSLSPAVRLEVNFLDKNFRGQFLVADGNVGILGRNVLNSVSLLFDGPRLIWQENRKFP